MPTGLCTGDVVVRSVANETQGPGSETPTDRVGEHADPDATLPQTGEQVRHVRVGERVRLPELAQRASGLVVVPDAGRRKTSARVADRWWRRAASHTCSSAANSASATPSTSSGVTTLA
jgi:hypothetical protein